MWNHPSVCCADSAQTAPGPLCRFATSPRPAGSHPQGDAKIYGRLPTKICYGIHHEAFGTVKTVPYRAFYSGQPTIKQPVGRGHLTPPELCLVASENWRKEQEKKKACAPSLKDVSTCLFLFLWQHRIILSADTASEVRQMLSQKRR